jgi:HNH endonuclease
MSDALVPGTGAPPRSSAQWTFVDRILVERDDLIGAIEALSALPDADTIIIKTLRTMGSPLARTHYRGLADEYERDHPGEIPMQATSLKHPPRRRVAFIRMLQQHLRELDARLPLDADLAPDASDGDDPQVPDSLSDADARTRVRRDIVTRQGQSPFRDALMRAYGGRCAVTGCDSPYALEAAHIRPYRGQHTNVVSNGLLLRADIHTLFDLGLLAVNPATLTIVLSDWLPGTHYKQFQDTPLTSPDSPELRPSQSLLTERWAWFQGKQAASPQTS